MSVVGVVIVVNDAAWTWNTKCKSQKEAGMSGDKIF